MTNLNLRSLKRRDFLDTSVSFETFNVEWFALDDTRVIHRHPPLFNYFVNEHPVDLETAFKLKAARNRLWHAPSFVFDYLSILIYICIKIFLMFISLLEWLMRKKYKIQWFFKHIDDYLINLSLIIIYRLYCTGSTANFYLLNLKKK